MKSSVLCLANCIILCCGIAVFGVGVWIRVDKTFMESLLGTELYITSAYILIVAGLLTTIISFLGCYGAMSSSEWMLKAHFCILLLIFCIMLTGGICGFIFRNEVKDKMEKGMQASIPKYGQNKPISDTWDSVQTYFKCCGVVINGTTKGQGYLIWQNHENLAKSNKSVPDSCCQKNDKASVQACQEDPQNQTHEKDCYTEVRSFAERHALILAVIGIAVSLALIVGMMLTCGYLRKVQRTKKKIGLA